MEHLGLKDTAYDIIKQKLLTGEIRPGSRVREDLLAEELSMSRTPVREAINQLSGIGFVEIIPRKGIFAVTYSLEELKDLIHVREQLSILSVRQCCERMNAKQIESVEKILVEYETACIKDEPVQRGLLDGQFHKALARYSRNKTLYQYLSEVEDKAIYARNMQNYDYYRNGMEPLHEHEKILKYIKEKNVEDAVEMMIKNVTNLFTNSLV